MGGLGYNYGWRRSCVIFEFHGAAVPRDNVNGHQQRTRRIHGKLTLK